jgi:iron complex transport system ATP-binding protein
MTSFLQGDRLSFCYGGRCVLNEVTVAVDQREFTIILGRNGSGKSTLLRIMAGLLKPESGSLQVMGRDLKDLSLSERAKVIGYLPQFHRPIFPFTVEDVVLTGRASYVNLIPGKEDRDIALRALERVGITHLRTRPFTELSGGEQQMVMIARVLAQGPRIVLLDEPTAHLDFLNQARLLCLVRELVNAELAVVAVLHDPNLAFLYGDRFIFLIDGRGESWRCSQKPWDTEVLQRVYGAELHSIPYRDRALVVPCVDFGPQAKNICP